MAEPNADERLTRIESNVAELEHLCDELNRVIIEQGKALQRLQNAHQQISDTMETIELDRIKPTNATPPHYNP